MKTYFADLHIHIGRTESGRPVKISAAHDLTFFNIADEASRRKGIDIVGIIDCHSPAVQEDIMRCLDRGEMAELAGGGIAYRETVVLLGSEIETRDAGLGPAHLIAYMPDLQAMRGLTGWMSRHMRNVNLSSQRLYAPARALQEEIIGRGGFLVPAHVFTPHKGLYGSCTDRIAHLLDPGGIAALEIGLSADSQMAGYISETDPYTFVSNSDAHSLGKIAREYNAMALAAPTFAEVRKALAREGGRHVAANYGLNPRLGKYHRAYCTRCGRIAETAGPVGERCPHCGSGRIVNGVLDRILAIADRDEPHLPVHRPPYHYQVPLEFIPGLGRRTLNALLERFGTEMNILHKASPEQLAAAAGEQIAACIVRAREGTLPIATGGGGRYGKVDLPSQAGS